jgi:hypothetical protein
VKYLISGELHPATTKIFTAVSLIRSPDYLGKI